MANSLQLNYYEIKFDENEVNILRFSNTDNIEELRGEYPNFCFYRDRKYMYARQKDNTMPLELGIGGEKITISKKNNIKIFKKVLEGIIVDTIK
jgi:hypothetical protein